MLKYGNKNLENLKFKGCFVLPNAQKLSYNIHSSISEIRDVDIFHLETAGFYGPLFVILIPSLLPLASPSPRFVIFSQVRFKRLLYSHLFFHVFHRFRFPYLCFSALPSLCFYFLTLSLRLSTSPSMFLLFAFSSCFLPRIISLLLFFVFHLSYRCIL